MLFVNVTWFSNNNFFDENEEEYKDYIHICNWLMIDAGVYLLLLIPVVPHGNILRAGNNQPL